MKAPRLDPAEATEEGRLADNIVYFARTLRKSGMRVGPASVKDAIEAVLAAGIGSRDDFYWTLHAVLVSRHGMQRPVEIVARADAGGEHRLDRILDRGRPDAHA